MFLLFKLESFVTIDYPDLESQSLVSAFRVKIPLAVYRGSGIHTYVEFEVRVSVKFSSVDKYLLVVSQDLRQKDNNEM